MCSREVQRLNTGTETIQVEGPAEVQKKAENI